jgi:hypothetical protein
VLVLLFVNCITVPCRATLLAFLPIAFSTIVLNVVGIVVLMLICVGLIITSVLGLSRLTFPQLKMARNLLALTFFMSLTYWCFNDVVFNSVLTPFRRLLETSLPTYTGSSVSTPRYFSGGFEAYSYSWALPVGISGAYVILSLYGFLKGRHRESRDALRTLPFIAGISGLILIIVGFASILNAPDASVERYTNIIAYALIIIPTALVCSKLVDNRRRLSTAIILGLLIVSVYVGSSSPDWTPFENPSFTAIRVTYSGLTEANKIVSLLPCQLMLYPDYDIPLGGVANLANLLHGEPQSYQTTRKIVNSVKAGTFDLFNPAYSKDNLNAIYVIRPDEVTNDSALDEYMNMLYNSGIHVMLKTP